MTPYEVYKDYLALRNHFNHASYDYFKYLKKSSANSDSFQRRKDKFFFEKMAKHRDPHGFMLANFVHDPKSWIRDMAYSDSAEAIYTSWLKKKDGLTYFIKSDLGKLAQPFDANFKIEDGQQPPILIQLLASELSLETVCVLVDLVGCWKYWNKELSEDVVWQEVGERIKKYTPFLQYDKPKIKKIVVDYFRDSE